MFSERFTKAAGIIDYSKLCITANSEFSSELPHHITQLIKLMRTTTPRTVLDMTAHIGGFSLPWAKQFPKDRLTSVEINDGAFQCLTSNVAVLRLKNIKCVHADSTGIQGKFDMVYMDPPWGGPDYRYKKALQLYLGRLSVPEVITRLFSGVTSQIYLKVPLNYDFQSLPFAYTVHTITSPNENKKFPDYFLVSLRKDKKRTKKK